MACGERSHMHFESLFSSYKTLNSLKRPALPYYQAPAQQVIGTEPRWNINNPEKFLKMAAVKSNGLLVEQELIINSAVGIMRRVMLIACNGTESRAVEYGKEGT